MDKIFEEQKMRKEQSEKLIEKVVEVIGNSVEKVLEENEYPGNFSSPVKMSKPKNNLTEKEISLGENLLNQTRRDESRRQRKENADMETLRETAAKQRENSSEHIVL